MNCCSKCTRSHILNCSQSTSSLKHIIFFLFMLYCHFEFPELGMGSNLPCFLLECFPSRIYSSWIQAKLHWIGSWKWLSSKLNFFQSSVLRLYDSWPGWDSILCYFFCVNFLVKYPKICHDSFEMCPCWWPKISN